MKQNKLFKVNIAYARVKRGAFSKFIQIFFGMR